MKTVVTQISNTFQAIRNCVTSGNTEWEEKHRQTLSNLLDNHMPSGSGWNSGTTMNMGKSNASSLVFEGSYHHMNDSGMYDGWTDHTVIVTPEFDGITIKVTGKNRNDIKEYLAELFHHALMREIA